MTAWHFIFKCCRSLVVLIEGGDLCSSNKESLPETCENGVQGVLFAGRCCASMSPGTERALRLRINSQRRLKGLVTNTRPGKCL